MEIKQYLLDKNGKAVGLEWENGAKTLIPFYVEYNLSDFNGNEKGYAEFLNGMVGTYEQERGLSMDANEPVPSMYPNDDVYQSRKRMWEQEQVLERHREKYTPQQRPVRLEETLPTDEYAGQRMGCFERKREWEKKLEEAKSRGDTNLADMARNEIKWAEKDLEKIPLGMNQRVILGQQEDLVKNLAGVLLDPKNASLRDDWGSERVDHDAIEAMRWHNNLPNETTILFPLEKARGSKTYKTVKPGNILHIDFQDVEKKNSFLRQISNGKDPHDLLYEMHLLPEGKDRKPTLEEMVETPQLMPQKVFETYQVTKKVFPEDRLAALSQREREILNASGGLTWPDRHLPPLEEELEPEHTQQEFEESLKPFTPAQ